MTTSPDAGWPVWQWLQPRNGQAWRPPTPDYLDVNTFEGFSDPGGYSEADDDQSGKHEKVAIDLV